MEGDTGRAQEGGKHQALARAEQAAERPDVQRLMREERDGETRARPSRRRCPLHGPTWQGCGSGSEPFWKDPDNFHRIRIRIIFTGSVSGSGSYRYFGNVKLYKQGKKL